MSSIFIVLPILTLLMFDLGLALRPADFMMVFRRPRAILVGLAGQILLLPIIVILLSLIFRISGEMLFGLMLIACCPGGSSSNIFSGIANGDVALSVSLTALSSMITLFTMPLFLGSMFEMPVGNLVVQNLVLVLVPVIVGMFLHAQWPGAATKIHSVLSRLAFPLLLLLAAIFFVNNSNEIAAHFGQLGLVITLLIILAMGGGWSLGWLFRLSGRERRTIVIEVGMQNAAQAITLSASPLVFNNERLAIPAIVYALMMNVILLAYVAIVGQWKS